MSVRSDFNLIRQNFRKLGLDVPTTLEEAFTHADGLGRPFGLPDHTATLKRAAELRAAGKSAAADKQVLSAVASMYLSDKSGILARIADDARTDALRDHADALHTLLAGVVDAANAKIRDAVAEGVTDWGPQSIATGGTPAFLVAWANARSATSALVNVVQAWRAIASSASLAHVSPGNAHLILAPAEPGAALGGNHDPLEAAYSGRELSLATWVEFANRLHGDDLTSVEFVEVEAEPATV